MSVQRADISKLQLQLNQNLLRGIMECKEFILYPMLIIVARTLGRWGRQTQTDSRRQRKATTHKGEQYLNHNTLG